MKPWTCPVCKTVIMLGEPPPSGKIRCPACDTEFAYPLRRKAAAGGSDRTRSDDPEDQGDGDPHASEKRDSKSRPQGSRG